MIGSWNQENLLLPLSRGWGLVLSAFREWAASWLSSSPGAERKRTELGTVLQNSSGSTSFFVSLAGGSGPGDHLDEGLCLCWSDGAGEGLSLCFMVWQAVKGDWPR